MKAKALLHAAAVTLGRKGGQVISEAKSRAARRNGRKGGRPAKALTQRVKPGK